jgi:hypothetical protein
MADDKRTPQSLTGAANRVVILAFDLLDRSLADSPDMLAATLKTDKVQNAIKTALDKFMLSRIPTTTGQMSEADAQALLKSLQSVATGPIKSELLDQIKKTPQYQALENGVNDFVAAAGCSSLGVWVNQNKTLLIVSGVVLAVGGTAALFVTKTGGPVVDFPLSMLKDAKVPIFKLGALSAGLTIGELKPSLSEAGAGIVLSDKFDGLTVDLKLGVTAFLAPSKQLGPVVMSKTSVFNIDTSGGAPKNNRVSLALTLRTNDDRTTASIGAIVEQGQDPKITFGAGYKPNKNMEVDLSATAGPKDAAVMATFKVFGF